MGGIFGGGGGGQSTVDPVAAGLRVQTSAYGLAIPIVYGRTRVTGNLIWFGDFTPIPHTTTQSSGGKGGGGGSSSNTSFTYTTSFALALCEGAIAAVYSGWRDKDLLTQAQINAIFTTMNGSYPQTPWSYLTTLHSGQAIGYQGIAYMAAANYDLGSSSSLPNHSFEIGGALPYNSVGGIYGANPKDVVSDLLINAHYGAGFPSAKIGSMTSFSNFCVASNIFISPSYTEQKPTQEIITDLMTITNCGVYFSEELLKIVPLSDTSITGNGVTYTAANTPVYDLTDDDFIVTDGEPPVKMMRNSTADAFNQIQIEFINSANQYNVEIAEARDQAAVETYGLITKDPITAHAITDAATARTVAQRILQRSLFVRNTFEFTLSWKYCLLEPTDIVTINDADLGLAAYAVRITAVEEDADGQLKITAEDYPAGVSHSAVYPSTSGTGWSSNYNVSGGSVVAPAFFEVPATKSLTGLAIGVAVTGNDANFGGCEIWSSYDGTTYKRMGKIYGGARYGVTTNTVNSAVDQVQNITLAGNGGQLITGSTNDADNLNTLCLIGDEYISHSTATLLSANNYAITLHKRGAYQTVAAAHVSGVPFIRVDNAIVYSDDLDLSTIGKTLQFKFLSVNRYDGAIQALADVAAYSYTVTGVMAKLPPSDVTAITIQGGKVSWPTVPDPDVIGYRLKFQYGINTDWGTAGLIHNGEVTDTPYTMNTIPSGVATIMVKAVDAFLNESLSAASLVVNFGQAITANIVGSYDYKAASWPGTWVNASNISGNLQASQSSPFYSANASLFYGLDLSVFYSNNYDALEWDSSQWTPPSISVGGNLTVAWNIAGAAVSIQYRINGAEAFYQPDATYFYNATGTTNFYSLPSDWMTWTGSVVVQNAGYQWKVTTVSGAVGGLLSSFTAQADLPTKNLTLNAISLSPSGTRLAGAIGYFNVISNIQLTLASGSTAVKLEIVDKSTTLGPMIIAKDSSGTGVAANVDALLQGY